MPRRISSVRAPPVSNNRIVVQVGVLIILGLAALLVFAALYTGQPPDPFGGCRQPGARC